MNYCEWIKCGDYTGSDCKAWGGTMKCKTQIEAEPYASAMLSARDKWWVANIQKEFHQELRNSMECTSNYCEQRINTEECLKERCLLYRWEQFKQSILEAKQ
jgi:hypothetical protein